MCLRRNAPCKAIVGFPATLRYLYGDTHVARVCGGDNQCASALLKGSMPRVHQAGIVSLVDSQCGGRPPAFLLLLDALYMST